MLKHTAKSGARTADSTASCIEGNNTRQSTGSVPNDPVEPSSLPVMLATKQQIRSKNAKVTFTRKTFETQRPILLGSGLTKIYSFRQA